MDSPTYDLSGQVVIVTGGGRGLGRAFAQALAGAGAKVAVVARTKSEIEETAALITQAGGTAQAYVADILDRMAASRLVADIEAHFGPVDTLVNNAAILSALGLEWDVDEDEWWNVVTVNLRGSYNWVRAVLPGMMARRRGRIINVSGIAAYGDFAFATAYCASKAALTNFSHNLSLATKAHGITVFALGPGAWTGMQEAVVGSTNVPAASREQFRAGAADAELKLRNSVNMLMLMASGRLDALTGRHIAHRDSPEALLSQTTNIIEKDLLTLRRREP